MAIESFDLRLPLSSDEACAMASNEYSPAITREEIISVFNSS